MNNKEKLYLAKVANNLTDDQRNAVINFMRSGPTTPNTSGTGSPSAQQNYARYHTNRMGNDFGMNQRLYHQAEIERLQNIENPTFKQQRELINAKGHWNPINRYATTGGYGQGGAARLGELGHAGAQAAKEIGNFANPVPAVKGIGENIVGAGLDVVRGADMMAQGAAGGGYQEREWLKNKPSFVGGMTALGKAFIDDPGGTAKELAVGEGALYNWFGGAGVLGKARRRAPDPAPTAPTPAPTRSFAQNAANYVKGEVAGSLNLDHKGSNRLATPRSKTHQFASTAGKTGKELYESQSLNAEEPSDVAAATL